MTLHPSHNAVQLFRLWITLAGTAATLPFLLLSLWWNIAVPAALFITCLTALTARLYPPHYFAHWRASYTEKGLTLCRGVFWHRTWHVPAPSLSSATWFTTPCSRKRNCGVLLLKHSGGITWIPFLETSFAETLLADWEERL